jgi:hypothetical protein
MKIKKLTMMAAVIAALAISINSAQALTYNQVQQIKKTVLGVPVPEMPAKAAEVVAKAEKKDRQATAVTAVRAIIMKHRAAAPLVISAVSKVAPDLAPALAVAATEVASEQAQVIAHAAATAAPEQAKEINLAVSHVQTGNAPVTANVNATGGLKSANLASATLPTVAQRGSASSGGPSQGTITITDTPINTSTGGNGTGTFGTTPPAQSGPGQVIYNQPPQ